MNARIKIKIKIKIIQNTKLDHLTISPANSSVGRVSDCSSEGRRFKPGLADVKPP